MDWKRTVDTLGKLHWQLGSYHAVEVETGVPSATVRGILLGEIKFSPQAIQAIRGRVYQSCKVYWVDEQPGPTMAVSGLAPRQCPITGRYFIPNSHHQKYAPGVTGAQKRAWQRRVKRHG